MEKVGSTTVLLLVVDMDHSQFTDELTRVLCRRVEVRKKIYFYLLCFKFQLFSCNNDEDQIFEGFDVLHRPFISPPPRPPHPLVTRHSSHNNNKIIIDHWHHHCGIIDIYLTSTDNQNIISNHNIINWQRTSLI
jgi:hypothetical protein